MGYGPDYYDHDRSGPKFAGKAKPGIMPGDVVLIARRHHGGPQVVGFGVVHGAFQTKLKGFKPPQEVTYRVPGFPLFIRKVLGCKPHTRNSHLTLKQVEKLQVELAHLKNFHLADRKLERELRCYYGQLNQLVRAALKFHKSIAM